MTRALLIRLLLAAVTAGAIYAASDRLLRDDITRQVLRRGEAAGLITVRVSSVLFTRSNGPFLDVGTKATIANAAYMHAASATNAFLGGVGGTTILWLTGGPLAHVRPFRVRPRIPGQTRCGRCHYPLAGLAHTATRCPECGRPLVQAAS